MKGYERFVILGCKVWDLDFVGTWPSNYNPQSLKPQAPKAENATANVRNSLTAYYLGCYGGTTRYYHARGLST